MLMRPSRSTSLPYSPLFRPLEVTDMAAGDGDTAKPGDEIEVHYVGVDFESGEEVDASWNRGKTVTVQLEGLIAGWQQDRKSTRLNSSHVAISYAVLCLKKKN